MENLIAVSSSVQDEARVASLVEAFVAWGHAPADALVAAGEWDADGEPAIAALYREVARRLQAVEDADLVYV